MKIGTWNVNGIRARFDPYFKNLLKQSSPDILCLQETKASPEQLTQAQKNPLSYHSYFSSSKEKKGYSGVAVYTKEEPQEVRHELGFERFDKEGRFIRLDFEEFILVNVYIPHGKHDKSDLPYKMESYRFLQAYLSGLMEKNLILTGDLNIARTDLDVALNMENKDNIMFTQEERLQLEEFLNLGFLDTFRFLNHKDPGYTFWSYTNRSREKDLGWRIDYIIVSEHLKEKIDSSEVMDQVEGSDHAPLITKISF